jgi:hypothetical protein
LKESLAIVPVDESINMLAKARKIVSIVFIVVKDKRLELKPFTSRIQSGFLLTENNFPDSWIYQLK